MDHPLQHEVQNAPTQPEDDPSAKDAAVDSKPNDTKDQPAQEKDDVTTDLADTHEKEDPSKQNATEPSHENTNPPNGQAG